MAANAGTAATSTTHAAGEGIENLFETVTQIFSSVDMLARPDSFTAHIANLSVVWAVVFVVVGLLCLLSGAKNYKTVTVALAFFVGLFAGYWLGKKIDAPYVIAGCLALLLGVAAYPLMKYAVSAFGGLAGAFVGANLWVGMAHALNKGAGTQIPGDAYWIGALFGLVVCGMMAFSLFKFSCVLFTSVTGATLAMIGVLCLLLSFQPWKASVVSGLTASQIVVPLLVFVPAVIGLILQQSWTPQMAGAKPDAKKA